MPRTGRGDIGLNDPHADALYAIGRDNRQVVEAAPAVVNAA
jgi:hypothetical protein